MDAKVIVPVLNTSPLLSPEGELWMEIHSLSRYPHGILREWHWTEFWGGDKKTKPTAPAPGRQTPTEREQIKQTKSSITTQQSISKGESDGHPGSLSWEWNLYNLWGGKSWLYVPGSFKVYLNPMFLSLGIYLDKVIKDSYRDSYTVGPPFPRGIHSKPPSGCLKPVVLNSS